MKRHLATCLLFFLPKIDIAVPSVEYNLRRTRKIWKDSRAALLCTQGQNQRLADRWRTPAPAYMPGQKVWLNTKDIPLNVESPWDSTVTINFDF